MKTKTGIVFEGGAMRGLFSAGVQDVLLENNIKFDGAIGVSAGAAFGVNYKSHQVGRVLRYNVRYARDPRLSSWQSWLKTGDLYGADFCYRELPEELDIFDAETFAKDPMEFWCVATDIQTGDPVYHKLINGKTADLQWIRASSSIPFFARPVKIGNRYYWDGGVSDSIPLDFFEKRGYNRNLVVLTQPKEYRKVNKHTYPFLKAILYKYPQVLKRLKTRTQDYNAVLDEIAKQERSKQIFVIRPPHTLNIGTMEKDPRELTRVYEIGRKTMVENMSSLKEFLKQS